MNKTFAIDYMTQLVDQADKLKLAIQEMEEIGDDMQHCLMSDLADIGISIQVVMQLVNGHCYQCGECDDE